MKKKIDTIIFSVMMLIALAVLAHAELVDMKDGTIYETDTQLSWLKDAGAGGIKSWDEAAAWAAGLKVGGLTGWRLPNADPACGFHYDCRNSEMGHLYYVSLDNKAGRLTNSGPFTNLRSDPSVVSNLYWSGTAFAPGRMGMNAIPEPPGAWLFNFYDGNQLGGKGDSYSTWAVRPGARSLPTPAQSGGTTGTILNKETK